MLDDISQQVTDSVNHFSDIAVLWAKLHLLNIIIIASLAWIAHKFLSQIITRLLSKTVRHDLFPTEIDRKKRLKTMASLINTTVQVGVWVVATMMIISELGIDTGPLIASAGVLGVAIGFGAQSLIKDFVSGIFIIAENQYRVGDIVQLNTANTPMLPVLGKVEAITIRTTVVRDIGGELIHVPNGVINVAINKTIDYGRINEDIVVAMDTDLEQLEHVINHVGKQLMALPEFDRIITEAPAVERIEGFNGNGVVVKIRGKTRAGEQWRVKTAMYTHLKKAFEKHGIKIADQNGPSKTKK